MSSNKFTLDFVISFSYGFSNLCNLKDLKDNNVVFLIGGGEGSSFFISFYSPGNDIVWVSLSILFSYEFLFSKLSGLINDYVKSVTSCDLVNTSVLFGTEFGILPSHKWSAFKKWSSLSWSSL